MLGVYMVLFPHPVYASLFFHDNDRRWKTAGSLGVNRLLLMLLLRLGHSRETALSLFLWKDPPAAIAVLPNGI